MRGGDKEYGGSIRIKIELVIIKIVGFFFLVIKHALVGVFEIDRIPIKGYFL